MGVITALEFQKRNKDRVNVYLDDVYAFSLDVVQAAMLRKGQVLTEAEIAVLRDDDAVSRAVDRAVRFLAYRPRSIQEVRQHLAAKDVTTAAIDAALERLSGLGYLDDRAFATFWVENRSQFKPLSPRALRYELRQKGVADAIIEELLVSLDVHQTAYRAAQQRVNRWRGSDHGTFRQKMGAFLQRRGFNFETSRDVIEQLINELEIQDMDYFNNYGTTDEE